jgi:DNA-binding LacI/PurR family transcriptional regulator
MPKHVTIIDVAREAGVDNSTVSLALRGDRRITERTRARIREVATKLNYMPNQLARSLSGGRSRVIGVMLPDMENRFFTPPLEEFQAVAEQRGYAINVKFCSWDSRREERGLAQFCESRVDGVIWSPASGSLDRMKALIDRLHASGSQFVLMGLGPLEQAPLTHQVGMSESEALQLGVAYLLGLGHRRIGIATATLMPGIRAELHRFRLAKLRKAFAAAGVTVADEDIFETADNDYGGVGIASVLRDRLADSLPTAIFAADDMLARGLIAGLHVAGLNVPDRISVLGFDNVPGDVSGPVPVTSVSVEARENGRQAIGLLLDVVEQKVPSQPYQSIVLHPRIVVCASCAKVDV